MRERSPNSLDCWVVGMLVAAESHGGYSGPSRQIANPFKDFCSGEIVTAHVFSLSVH